MRSLSFSLSGHSTMAINSLLQPKSSLLTMFQSMQSAIKKQAKYVNIEIRCVWFRQHLLFAKWRRLCQVAAMAASSATGTTNLCNTGTSCFCHAWKELAKVNGSHNSSEYPPIIPITLYNIMHTEYPAGFATCNSFGMVCHCL